MLVPNYRRLHRTRVHDCWKTFDADKWTYSQSDWKEGKKGIRNVKMWCEVYAYTTGCNVHGEKNCRRKIIRKREQRISERLKVLSAIKNIWNSCHFKVSCVYFFIRDKICSKSWWVSTMKREPKKAGGEWSPPIFSIRK